MVITYIFIPFDRFSSFTYNPGRPVIIWSAMKLPTGIHSFTGLCICKASSAGCGFTLRIPSVIGLTC